MAPHTLSARDPDLADRRVLVLGLGTSGLAAVRLLAQRGAAVTVADARREAELERAPAARAAGATIVGGGHPPELAHAADLVVLSPGVPATSAVVREAQQLGVPVWSEIELASRYCRGRVIGITGSNGKSTTTAMTGVILRAAGIPGGTGGNLGSPFVELLEQDTPHAVHAVELSSFQLETVDTFRAAVAVVVNLSPDHQDRYPSFEAYADAKARLLESQEPGDAAILNGDDAPSRRFDGSVRGRGYLFSARHEVERGAFLRNGRIVLRTEAGEDDILAVADLSVPGEHNVQNALAAALAGRIAGCPAEAIATALRAFRALPHRLEFVGSFDGVAFYDDSKATNLDAAMRAVVSFPAGVVHWILGGRDKGAAWSSVTALARERARRVLLVGEAAATVRGALEGAVDLEDCGTIATAVRVGFERALPGDVVLLAPGCASFDQYRNYEERGDDFRRAVQALFPDGGSRA
jgi:UDP-N-acetylmuramoylalanine--D-glutamate ligase